MRKTTSSQEILFVAIGFALSMMHWTLCAVFFAFLLLFLNQGIVGCIKGMLIMTTRGILSIAVSCSLNNIVQMEKWAIIFIFSFYILYVLKYHKEKVCTTNLRVYVTIFASYIILASFITSSYPVVSAFKIIAYAVPFCAVVSAVSITNQDINWLSYLQLLLTPIILLCALTIPFDRFRIVNESFQGAINHPNLMGIFGAIYIGITLYNIAYGRQNIKFIFLILLVISFYMIYLSDSRTGMFSAIIMLAIYLVSLRRESKIKVFALLFIVILFVDFYFSCNPEVLMEISEEVTRFVYKRDTDDILESRLGQLDASQLKYEAHPLIGAGFAVPYKEGITDYQFSLSLTYEAGNILIAVLGDCGIIGSILFWGYIFYILLHTKQRKWVLFFLPIVVSMGEMAFFATNNVAIYYYFLYGICLGYDEGE